MLGLSDPVAAGLGLWGLAGFVVAVLFLIFGFDRLDAAAHRAYAVRPLMLPGLVLLWPLVVWRWALLASRQE